MDLNNSGHVNMTIYLETKKSPNLFLRLFNSLNISLISIFISHHFDLQNNLKLPMGNITCKFSKSSPETQKLIGRKTSKKSNIFNTNEYNQKLCNIELIFPHEIISEILSWLPVKCLLRLQLVSKQWHALVRETWFIQKHTSRVGAFWNWHYVIDARLRIHPPQHEIFHFICGCDGLILVRSNASLRYYVWNPSTRRILELPYPHKDNYEIFLHCIPHTGSYKLVCIYDNMGNSGEGWEILTVGKNNSWRHISAPNSEGNESHIGRKKISVVSAENVVHCIRTTVEIGSDIPVEIVSLDLVTESFTATSLPIGMFADWSSVGALNWKRKLAFVERVKGNIHLLELEDYKRSKWGERKIAIPLNLVKSDTDVKNNCVRMFTGYGDSCFWWKDKDLYSCKIAAGCIGKTDFPPELTFNFSNRVYMYQPSLVGFEGMQPDTKLKCLRRHLPV